MPIYEYVCSECSSKFELLRPMGQMNQKAACPGCGNPAEKVFSKFACFSEDASGVSSSIGGSSCSSCSAGSCDSCGS